MASFYGNFATHKGINSRRPLFCTTNSIVDFYFKLILDICWRLGEGEESLARVRDMEESLRKSMTELLPEIGWRETG